MLTKDLGVDAVLSIVEDFELDCSTAIGRYRTLCILFCTYLHMYYMYTYIHINAYK